MTNDLTDDRARPVDRLEFYRGIDKLDTTMTTGMKGINERLDTLNGRTRKIEESVAVQWRLWLIVGAIGLVGLGIILTRLWL